GQYESDAATHHKGKISEQPSPVQLVGVEAFGFEEHLVALGVGELHDLVFDGWAIPRPSSADRPAVQGRFPEMRADDLLHFFPRPRDPAGQLTRQLDVMIEGEAVGGAVSVLALELGQIEAPNVHELRGAGHEACW